MFPDDVKRLKYPDARTKEIWVRASDFDKLLTMYRELQEAAKAVTRALNAGERVGLGEYKRLRDACGAIPPDGYPVPE